MLPRECSLELRHIVGKRRRQKRGIRFSAIAGHTSAREAHEGARTTQFGIIECRNGIRFPALSRAKSIIYTARSWKRKPSREQSRGVSDDALSGESERGGGQRERAQAGRVGEREQRAVTARGDRMRLDRRELVPGPGRRAPSRASARSLTAVTARGPDPAVALCARQQATGAACEEDPRPPRAPCRGAAERVAGMRALSGAWVALARVSVPGRGSMRMGGRIDAALLLHHSAAMRTPDRVVADDVHAGGAQDPTVPAPAETARSRWRSTCTKEEPGARALQLEGVGLRRARGRGDWRAIQRRVGYAYASNIGLGGLATPQEHRMRYTFDFKATELPHKRYIRTPGLARSLVQAIRRVARGGWGVQGHWTAKDAGAKAPGCQRGDAKSSREEPTRISSDG
ncbi:hypothetical protein DFH09DRAFT_1071504 [Mycena vulgaris]|nr:hypothetical protein DFH09DRAFT_1071504 [Mycena vulgaris]